MAAAGGKRGRCWRGAPAVSGGEGQRELGVGGRDADRERLAGGVLARGVGTAAGGKRRRARCSGKPGERRLLGRVRVRETAACLEGGGRRRLHCDKRWLSGGRELTGCGGNCWRGAGWGGRLLAGEVVRLLAGGGGSSFLGCGSGCGGHCGAGGRGGKAVCGRAVCRRQLPPHASRCPSPAIAPRPPQPLAGRSPPPASAPHQLWTSATTVPHQQLPSSPRQEPFPFPRQPAPAAHPSRHPPPAAAARRPICRRQMLPPASRCAPPAAAPRPPLPPALLSPLPAVAPCQPQSLAAAAPCQQPSPPTTRRHPPPFPSAIASAAQTPPPAAAPLPRMPSSPRHCVAKERSKVHGTPVGWNVHSSVYHRDGAPRPIFEQSPAEFGRGGSGRKHGNLCERPFRPTGKGSSCPYTLPRVMRPPGWAARPALPSPRLAQSWWGWGRRVMQ